MLLCAPVKELPGKTFLAMHHRFSTTRMMLKQPKKTHPQEESPQKQNAHKIPATPVVENGCATTRDQATFIVNIQLVFSLIWVLSILSPVNKDHTATAVVQSYVVLCGCVWNCIILCDIWIYTCIYIYLTYSSCFSQNLVILSFHKLNLQFFSALCMISPAF